MFKKNLSLDYALRGNGWATMSLQKDFNSVTINVSYIHDTLGDLATAVNLLLKGAQEVSVLLINEPGEHLIFLRSFDNKNLDVEVRWFKYQANRDFETEKEFETIFKEQDTIKRFVQQVLNILNLIIKEEGFDGYKEKWINHDFPIDQFKRLKEILNKK